MSHPGDYLSFHNIWWSLFSLTSIRLYSFIWFPSILFHPSSLHFSSVLLQLWANNVLFISGSSDIFALHKVLMLCFSCAHSDHNSHSYIGETWSSTASGADPYPVLPHPGDPQLDLSALVSLETDSGGEEGREETIVYLWMLIHFRLLKQPTQHLEEDHDASESGLNPREVFLCINTCLVQHLCFVCLFFFNIWKIVFVVFFCNMESYWKHGLRNRDKETEVVSDLISHVSCTLAQGTILCSMSIFCFLCVCAWGLYWLPGPLQPHLSFFPPLCALLPHLPSFFSQVLHISSLKLCIY